jgi:3-hydroxyisobutyrate dehydrogenase
VSPAMAALAAHFTHIGALGAGQTAKILNQAIVGAGYVLMAETLALAEAAGLDAAKLPDCLAGGFADSTLLRRLYPQMHDRAFEPPRAYARQLLKDLKNVRQFADEVGVELPLVDRAVDRFDEYVAAGNAMKDPAAIALFYQRRAGGDTR